MSIKRLFDMTAWLRGQKPLGGRVPPHARDGERVAPLVGAARVLPAVVEISAESQHRGRIRLFGRPRLTVPEGDDGTDFAALCQGSGIEVTSTADFVTAAWTKLCLNAAGAAGRRRVGRAPSR